MVKGLSTQLVQDEEQALNLLFEVGGAWGGVTLSTAVTHTPPPPAG